MAIKKQEFYEGAALHQLVRNGSGQKIAYSAPFFIVEDALLLYLKYSTGVRTPWGFTFTPEEQHSLKTASKKQAVVIGLICGSDGIAKLDFERYSELADESDSSIWISCARKHRQHYEITGPNGSIDGKIPPSDWYNLLINN